VYSKTCTSDNSGQCSLVFMWSKSEYVNCLN